MTNRNSHIFFAAVLLLCAIFSQSQVTVAIAPNPHPQFLDASGKPLASGFLYTYQAGTTTLLSTYADSGGTIPNADPIPLDVSGAPSNGSVQTGIWLANTSYKFCAYNAALVQQWCTDNVTGYLGLLNLPNIWTFQQTFSLPIVDSATDNQLVFGSAGNQTTIDAPPPTGNVTLHTPSTNDTLVGRDTTDTLTHKTLTNPIVNGVQVLNSPGSYTTIANAAPTGTILNGIVKLTTVAGVAKVTLPPLIPPFDMVGICVAGCGNTGTATIQMTGVAPCVFDGSPIAGHWVTASSSVAGNCQDSGLASGPDTSIGLALAGGAPGTYSVLLMPPGPFTYHGVTNLGSSAIGAGTCASLGVTATGAVAGSKVIWSYSGSGATSADLKLIVSPSTTSGTVTWNICNPTAGSLTQSGNAVVTWSLFPQ